MQRITVKANAKINLTLGITGKRDDGYHEIDTIMQSVSICDIIKISKSDTISVVCYSGGIDGQENIAYSAARLFFDVNGLSGGAQIEITKNIPIAAGMGGGSADAAAVLCALNDMYGTCLTDDRLCDMAIKLGADVPFFIKGGTQRARGIGEKLTSIEPLGNCWILIAISESKSSTAEMYRKLDSMKIILPDTETAIKAIADNNIPLLADNIVNSFSAVWDSELKNLIASTGALGVSLSGSGPAWFGIYDDLNKTENAMAVLKSHNINCFITRPCDYAIKIV